MKISHISAHPLSGHSPKGGWSNEIKPEDSVHTLIVIRTDEDVLGVGSVFSDGRLVSAALDVLRPLLEGESAIEPMRVSEKLHQNTFWMGRGGAITNTISGIDIAMWDILGKVAGQPIGRLLGGTYRKKVRAYASILMETPDLMEERCTFYRKKGFRAIKIGWGPFGRTDDPAMDRRIVEAARSGATDGCALMVDAGGSDAFWSRGLSWAVRTAEMLADYDVAWFEEPLVPDALEDHAALRARSPVPIAGGECLTRRQTYLPWFTGRALDIVQPDVTKVGGISEQIRIARTAEDHGIRYVGHGWNTAVGLAADLHLAAAMPHTDLVEYIGGSPYVDDLVETDWQLDENGRLDVPDQAGLGITFDRKALAGMTSDIGFLY